MISYKKLWKLLIDKNIGKYEMIKLADLSPYTLNKLTRARQGMAIYIPEGDLSDDTRKGEYYDKTYDYLKSLME